MEEELQRTLDEGSDVWVIGDVHGYFGTLEALIQRLDMGDKDAVVMLGDLIDRGPTSADVVNYEGRPPTCTRYGGITSR